MARTRFRTLFPFLALALAAGSTACGGDDEKLDYDGAPPIEPDAGSEPDGGGTPAGCTCVTLGADYEAGVGILSTVSLPDLTVTQDRTPQAISSDPVVRLLSDGRLWVVNRFGADNITIIDPETYDVDAQFSTGAGSNPHDVVLHGDKAYVVAFASPDVLVYDTADLDAPPDRIDLSSYDVDGVPEAVAIWAEGDTAFVLLQRLDESFMPNDVGLVAVIDLANDTVTSTFELTAANPAGRFVRRGDELLVSTVPDYFDTSLGCVERITISPPGSAGCLIDHQTIGGHANVIVPVDDELYLTAIGFDAEFNPLGKLVHVAADGSVTSPPLSPDTQVVSDVALCEATGQLVVNDTSIAGIRVYGVDGGDEVTTQPIDIGLPPAFAGGILCW
jgi:hypothetical protein